MINNMDDLRFGLRFGLTCIEYGAKEKHNHGHLGVGLISYSGGPCGINLAFQHKMELEKEQCGCRYLIKELLYSELFEWANFNFR